MNDKEKMPTTRWRVLCDEIRLFPPAGKLVFLCYVNKANVRTRWNYLLNGKRCAHVCKYTIFEIFLLTFEFQVSRIEICVIFSFAEEKAVPNT